MSPSGDQELRAERIREYEDACERHSINEEFARGADDWHPCEAEYLYTLLADEPVKPRVLRLDLRNRRDVKVRRDDTLLHVARAYRDALLALQEIENSGGKAKTRGARMRTWLIEHGRLEGVQRGEYRRRMTENERRVREWSARYLEHGDRYRALEEVTVGCKDIADAARAMDRWARATPHFVLPARIPRPV